MVVEETVMNKVPPNLNVTVDNTKFLEDIQVISQCNEQSYHLIDDLNYTSHVPDHNDDFIGEDSLALPSPDSLSSMRLRWSVYIENDIELKNPDIDYHSKVGRSPYRVHLKL